MKTKILLTLIAFAFASISITAQTFQDEMTTLHKNAVKTCGMIKAPGNHDNVKVLKALNNLKTEIATNEAKYVKNPPAEYAKDPLLKSYFEELDDIVNALIERVKINNYARATMNCSRICMVFNKMHMNNNTFDLTDMMFSWKMQMTMTMNMLNAGNSVSAYKNLHKVDMAYNKMLQLKNTKNNDVFIAEFNKVDNLYKDWSSAMMSKNENVAKSNFAQFNKVFGKAFILSI